MVCVCQIQLGEALGKGEAVEQLTNQGQRIPVLDIQIVESSIMMHS